MTHFICLTSLIPFPSDGIKCKPVARKQVNRVLTAMFRKHLYLRFSETKPKETNGDLLIDVHECTIK